VVSGNYNLFQLKFPSEVMRNSVTPPKCLDFVIYCSRWETSGHGNHT